MKAVVHHCVWIQTALSFTGGRRKGSTQVGSGDGRCMPRWWLARRLATLEASAECSL